MERNSSFPTYSIAIRTLGTSGEKYRKLLDSIQGLTVQPAEILVVLPEGYQPPKYRLGCERIIYSPKGMIIQRLKALEYIKSEFVLFCDDDVELAPDFIEKLYDPLCNSGFQCAAGPLLEFFPPAGPKYWLASLLGGACVMLHGRKKNYVRILKTGGWSYNRSIDTKSHKIYRTESLPWTCFFIRTDVMKKIQFEDEQWSERNGYAAFEDRAMFYKLLKNGYSSCVVSDACYKHNDGQTSTRELRLEPVYARAFNHYVFWHRYIYTLCRHWGARLWAKLCIGYYINLQKIYHILLVNAGREEREVLLTVKRGFKDAKAFVKSLEYAKLPKVIL